MRVDPVIEQSQGAFGGVLKSVVLSLAFSEVAVECSFQDRGPETRKILVDSELLFTFAGVKGDETLRIPDVVVLANGNQADSCCLSIPVNSK